MALFTGVFNLFRILADASHTLSKLFLIWAIHWNRSAEGVSLITQVLYALVFVTRYLDLFWTSPFASGVYFFLFTFKIFYIVSSAYIVFLMVGVYARTREREKAWKFGIYCLVTAGVLALPLTAAFQKSPMTTVTIGGIEKKVAVWVHPFKFSEILWTFSIVLESLCIAPQLLLLRQTTVPTVLDSYYLLTLGSYRAFYILNWIVRAADPAEHHFDPIAVVFGIVQTALYIDFAWVYLGRQRVKLRAGGVVDNEDLGRGWLVGRLVGKHKDLDEEEGSDDGHLTLDGGRSAGGRSQNGHAGGKWGKRGISVSADEGLLAADRQRPLADPGAFEDLSDEEDAEEVEMPSHDDGAAGSSASHHSPVGDHDEVGNGSEWADAEGKS